MVHKKNKNLKKSSNYYMIIRLAKLCNGFNKNLGLSILLMFLETYLYIKVLAYLSDFIYLIQQEKFDLVLSTIKEAILISSFFFIIQFSSHYIQALYSNFITEKLVNTSFQHIIECSYEWWENKDNGNLIYTINYDSEKISENIISNIFLLINNIVMCTGAFIYLCNINFYITIFVVIITFIMFMVNNAIKDILKKYSKEILELFSKMMSTLTECVQEMPVIRIFNIQGVFLNRFEDIFNTAISKMNKRAFIVSLTTKLIPMANKVIILIVTFLICLKIAINGGSIGVYISFMLLIDKIQNPIFSTSQIIIQMQQGFASVDRLLSTIDTCEKKTVEKRIDEIDNQSEMVINFENVFYNNSNCEILKGINFKIHKGEKVAFVGRSGSGKSTIIKLICGLISPSKGSAQMHSMNIKEHIQIIRNCIAYVPQMSKIFCTSIKKNIEYGANSSIEFKDIVDATKMAQAYDFINKFDNKFETIISENSSNISGGQRQRLSLSRAFIRNSEILIFDEPDASLDNETVYKLYSEIVSNFKDKTIIIVAHNLESIKWVDKIFVVEDGKIIKETKSNELEDFFRKVERTSFDKYMNYKQVIYH